MRVRLWGTVALGVDGRPDSFPAGRAADLLACLAWQPDELVRDEVLIERMWGEELPEDPRDALYTCAKRLRRALGEGGADPGALVRGRAGYALRAAPERVDVHHFRRLARAAGETGEPAARAFLYGRALGVAHGAPMAGFDSPWAERARQALHRERLAAQLANGSAWLVMGCHRELIAELTELTVEHPWNEAVSGLLMDALEKAGQPNEALAEFARVREGLARHLGVAPGPALHARFERLLAATPVRGAAA
ncbi:DNA-binding transcriptional activator of the SARP family [Streptomyces zhaozhouensis]|uniref:DNA-binding transcriptional activator of the SARP family n=1 Tax=Streptomyces zhaozhouensis TaxID=1300267 RepID=A0A286DTV3_9ACTN|nr:BTAD domain-containing putative transcriptional regulator [Streptomyces zhaozhouensis]SOD62085.1 DNA-binding transcriptional activator of the SARP family [Streptomyces zhaozhouensis]